MLTQEQLFHQKDLTAIGRDAWVNEALLLVDHGRPSLNAFRRAGLPEAGLNVDFPSVQANTIDADVQAAQGDTLTFGKLSLETKSNPSKDRLVVGLMFHGRPLSDLQLLT